MKRPLKDAALLVTEAETSTPRPYLALEHVASGTGRLLPGTTLDEREPAPSGMATARPGDVLFGKLRPYLAKVHHAEINLLASTELMCLRPERGVSSRWLYYTCLSKPVVEWAVATAEGVKMPRTNWEKFREFRMDIPDAAKQRAIADFLDRETARIDALIAKKQQLLNVLLERVAAERTRMLVEREDCVPTPLMHLTDPARPIVYGIVQAGPHDPDGIPYIKTGDLLNLDPTRLSRTTPEIHHQYRRAAVHPGDIVIAMRASIGLAVVVPPSLPVANLTQGTARIAAARAVNSKWLFAVLQTDFVQEQCDVRAVGTTFRTLNIWDLRRIRIPTPPADVQDSLALQIVRVEQTFKNLRDALDKQVGILQEHRQALITAAVTGQMELHSAA